MDNRSDDLVPCVFFWVLEEGRGISFMTIWLYCVYMCISYTIYLVLYRVFNHEERGRNWRKDPTSKKHPETPIFVFFNLLETEGVWVDGLDGLDSASPIFVFVRGWRQVLLTTFRTTPEGSAEEEELGERATRQSIHRVLERVWNIPCLWNWA